MEDFEGGVCAFGIGEIEEVALGCERFCFEADLLGPVDEVGEMEVEGEVLVTGVLVGFGREEALVLEVGAKRSKGTAVVVLLLVSAVVDGEDFTFLEF